MGRAARAWWNRAKGGWYVELDGRQVRLAKGREARGEAQRELRRLLAERDLGKAAARDVTCSDVFALFLAHTQGGVDRGERVPRTLADYTRWLGDAEEAFGRVAAAEVRPKDLAAWLDAHPRWGKTSRFNGVTHVRAAFRWARRAGHIEVNPLADMELPRPERRGTSLGAERVGAILAAASPGRDARFIEFLRALSETGCRPGEVMGLTAAMIDLGEAVWRVPNKTGHATGETTRTVHLTPAMVELSRELAARHPEGPVFRNGRGNPWTDFALSCRFARLRKKGLVGKGESPYSVRHGFATDGLAAGVPIATVAALMGHRDVSMVGRVYGHLAERSEHLKEAAKKTRPGG